MYFASLTFFGLVSSFHDYFLLFGYYLFARFYYIKYKTSYCIIAYKTGTVKQIKKFCAGRAVNKVKDPVIPFYEKTKPLYAPISVDNFVENPPLLWINSVEFERYCTNLVD